MRLLVLAVLFLLATLVREGGQGELEEAALWLPTGVAVFGAWRLGWSAVVVVTLVSALFRWAIGNLHGMVVTGALGSAAEAVLGAVLLRRLGVHAAFARLRDVFGLFLVAAIAPLASIAMSWAGRSLFDTFGDLPFYSGWTGWWRMNALGLMVAVSLLGTWSDALSLRPTLRDGIAAVGLGLGVAAVLGVVLAWLAPGGIAVMLLQSTLLFALIAALRFGPRGAVAIAACAAIALALATAHGLGPFLAFRTGQRHGALQLFELSMMAVPLVFGALIAERKRLEGDLRQAQKLEAVGRLAGGIAHDFNNVLTVIIGCAELLLAKLPPGNERDDARMIADSADRAARLTRQMLAFSRQQVLAPEVVDVAAIVEGIAGLLRRAVGETIRLTIDREAGATLALADRGQIEQIVMNLVLNARDALPDGGRVRIAIGQVDLAADFVQARGGTASGRHVRLSVADDGLGMDAVTRAHAFEPFYTTKSQGGGTGLGLATVWGIAHQSGGIVDLDSAPGRGTTVSLYLPAAGVPTPSAVPASDPATAPRPATILVAEDDDGVRDRLVRELRGGGHSVLESADAEAALRLAATGAPIQLLVTDVMMPQRDGRELADRLRAERPELRVLFVSGYSNRVFDADGSLPRGTAFLAKPFSRAELLESVGELLAAPVS